MKMNLNENIKKILIALICVVIIGASVGFGYFMAKNPADKETTESTSEVQQSTTTTDAAQNQNTTRTTDNPTPDNNEDTDIAKLILGQWTDNANLSGYEFLENGVMKVMYFNMSSLNLDGLIEGTYTGTYKLEGDRLTVSYTIYSKAVVKVYKVKVTENTLTLTGDGDKAVYVRKGAEQGTMENLDTELLGEWSSNLSGYNFKDTGEVIITYIDLSSMGINLPISGDAKGTYTIDGDKLDIRFSIYSGVIEEKYTYSIEGSVLTLRDRESGETGTYIKSAGDE